MYSWHRTAGVGCTADFDMSAAARVHDKPAQRQLHVTLAPNPDNSRHCPAYNHIRVMHMSLFQYCCTVADFLSLYEPNACGGYLRDCFACRKEILSV